MKTKQNKNHQRSHPSGYASHTPLWWSINKKKKTIYSENHLGFSNVIVFQSKELVSNKVTLH